ncbi:MAG: carboxypeptidase regulatory-like domain-containing protein, partial [Verrucomicrobia bacterium]|nr:carboxypeptidase regulatory-like domain-containing protein [Verrucomicrobiota bacterium]
GAVVIVTPSWGPENLARTDAKGEYSIDWQAQTGMRNVKHFVVARDVEQDLAAIESIGVNQKSADLRLGPGLSISGTVDDEKGAPLPRANINLNIMAGNMGGMVEYGRIRLHSDGTFTIPALPMGQQYMVSATADGYGTEGRNVGAAQSRTNSVRLAAFRLRAADRLLAGIVLGTDNKPLMGAHVSIFGRGQPNGNTSTDATGHFEFKVCGGPVRIFVWSPSQSGRNRSANCAARGGDTHLVVKMGARQSQRQMMAAMEIPLKPQLWTLGAVAAWPVQHKVGAIILLSLQAALLLGTAGGIFWHARRRPLRP